MGAQEREREGKKAKETAQQKKEDEEEAAHTYA